MGPLPLSGGPLAVCCCGGCLVLDRLALPGLALGVCWWRCRFRVSPGLQCLATVGRPALAVVLVKAVLVAAPTAVAAEVDDNVIDNKGEAPYPVKEGPLTTHPATQ